MKSTFGVILGTLVGMVMSCGGDDSQTPQERLVGSWVYSNSSGSTGIDLKFGSDANYSVQLLQLTSTTSANDEVETGIYSATDSTITFTPQKYTCPVPDPTYTLTYNFNGDSLAMLFSSGAIAFTRYTGPASTNAALTFGCFQSDGTFFTSPLAPVSN